MTSLCDYLLLSDAFPSATRLEIETFLSAVPRLFSFGGLFCLIFVVDSFLVVLAQLYEALLLRSQSAFRSFDSIHRRSFRRPPLWFNLD